MEAGDAGLVEIAELAVGDEPEAWRASGFRVEGDGTCQVGGVRLRIVGRADGPGMRGWTLTLAGPSTVDGVPTGWADGPPVGADDPGAHLNGVTGIDHVVALTPDLDRTTAALSAIGLEARRTRDAGRGRVQRFFRLGTVILELVGPAEPTGEGPARLWGLAFTVADLDATVAALAGRIGDAKEAVQPGRRIATLHAGEDVSVPVAFMSPEPGVTAPPRR